MFRPVVVPVKLTYLRKWLLENGYAEEMSGYGHVSAEELAQALVDHFDIYQYEKELRDEETY